MNVELASNTVYASYGRGIGRQEGRLCTWNRQAGGSVMNVELAGKRVGYARGIGKQEGRL